MHLWAQNVITEGTPKLRNYSSTVNIFAISTLSFTSIFVVCLAPGIVHRVAPTYTLSGSLVMG